MDELTHDQLVHIAVASNDPERVRSFLERAPLSPDGKRSLLAFAAWGRHTSCIEALLPHCDPLGRGAQGESALLCCAWNGDEEGARLLLPFSDLDAADHKGRTALDCALAGQFGALADMIMAEAALREAALLGESASPGPAARASPRI